MKKLGQFLFLTSVFSVILNQPTILGASNAKCVAQSPSGNINMAATSAALTGKIGLYVAQLAPGKDFKVISSVTLNQNDVFPLASAFKTSVLYEFLRQVDAKKQNLEDRFQINTGNRSLDNYPYDNSTALTLMNRMIKNSDNTATDILMRRVGFKSMQNLLNELNLCQTRVILSTKAWWLAEAGLGGKDFPANDLLKASENFAKAKPKDQLAIATRLDQLAVRIDPVTLEKKLDSDYFEERIVSRSDIPTIDRNLQNSSTPYEWAVFLHQAFAANDMSNLAKGLFRQIAGTEDTQKYLKIPFSYFGGKDGYTAYIRTLTGYIETPDGKRAIYVYFNEDSKTFDTYKTTPQAFELINAALKAVLGS